MKKLFRANQKGFSLAEVIVVMAILAIIGAVALGSLRAHRESAKTAGTVKAIKGMENNVTAWGEGRPTGFTGLGNAVLVTEGFYVSATINGGFANSLLTCNVLASNANQFQIVVTNVPTAADSNKIVSSLNGTYSVAPVYAGTTLTITY